MGNPGQGAGEIQGKGACGAPGPFARGQLQAAGEDQVRVGGQGWLLMNL